MGGSIIDQGTGRQGGLDHDVSVDIKMLGHVFHQGLLSVGAKKVNGNEVFG